MTTKNFEKLIEEATNNVVSIFLSTDKHELIFTEKDIQKYFEHYLLNNIEAKQQKYIHQEFPTHVINENSARGVSRKARGHFDFVVLHENHFSNCQSLELHPSLQQNSDSVENYYTQTNISLVDTVVEFKFGRFQSSTLNSSAAGIIASDIIKIKDGLVTDGLAWDVIKMNFAHSTNDFKAYWLIFEECGKCFEDKQNKKRIASIEVKIIELQGSSIEDKKICLKVLEMFKRMFEAYEEPNSCIEGQVEGLEWLTVKYSTRRSKY